MGQAEPAPQADAGRGLMDGAAVPNAAAPPWDLPGEGEAELAHARRARLRAAQEAASEARWRAERALAVADTALAAVTAARGVLHGHADVGDRIAQYHAGLLRAGAGERTGQRTGLPADLTAARGAAFAAEVELSDAEAAHDILSVEAREAGGAAAEAGARLRAAVDELVRAEVEAVMVAVRRAECEAGRGRVLLLGYVHTRALSEPPAVWPLQQLLMDPWNDAVSEVSGASRQGASVRWQEFRRALLSDAGAAFLG